MTMFSVLINPGFLNPNTAKKLSPFLDIAMDIIEKRNTLSPVEFMQYVIRRSGIENALMLAKEKEDTNALENVFELVGAVEGFIKDNPDSTIADFMQSVALVSDTDEMDDDNYVTIATVHAVKGLEFDTVFIIGLEEGIFPVNRAIASGDIEEERRLMYVAITRAKRRLYAINARQRFRFGEMTYAPKSRFITEMQGGKVSVRATNSMYQGATNKYNFDVQKAITNAVYGVESKSQFNKSMVASSQKPQQKAKSNVDYSMYKQGVMVEHSKFGKGIIISTVGDGEDKTAAIAFKGLGVKRFSLAIAAQHLTVIEE